MSKIKGVLEKNGTVIAIDIEFSIITQDSHGKRNTRGTFDLPASVNVDIELTDIMFDIVLHDGRREKNNGAWLPSCQV